MRLRRSTENAWLTCAAAVITVVALGSGPVSRAAAEDASVIVLGLRSVEGDDDFANAMTEALRSAARKVTGWKVLDRSVSMTQMSLAHGCDDVDVTCLTDIAKGLQADRMLFGTVRRTAARTKYDFELTVSIFNAGLRSIGVTEVSVIPRAEGKVKKALATRAEPLVAKLAASDAGAGLLSLQVNVPTAEVKLDGQVVGLTANYLLQLERVAEGDHKLEISALGHLAHSQRVRVSAGQRSEVKVNLEPVPDPEPETLPGPVAAADEYSSEQEGGSSIAWLGYTLIGVGAASLAGWGVSMYVVGQTNEDETFLRYKRSFAQSNDDVCELADNNNTASGRVTQADLSEVKSLCSTGRAFNLLQWVFLGAGVLSASIGTVILVSDGGEPEHAKLPRPSLSFQPQVGRRSLALQTTLRF
jgi:TolB-like protein